MSGTRDFTALSAGIDLAYLEHFKAPAPFPPYGGANGKSNKGAPLQGAGELPLDLASCLITSLELDTLTVPKRSRLLGKWLCEGDLGYIFAPRGVGKTWLGMALPKAISQQTELGLWEAGESVNSVLYVDGEMPLELTQFRSRALNIEKGKVTYLHHDQVFTTLGTSLNIGDNNHRDAITSLLVSEGFKVMMLDNLSSLASGIDENKGDEYEPVAHWLLELRRRKITVIVIHHAGRNGLMRGHSKREDACSWILSLRDAKEDGDEGAKFVSHFDKPSRNTGDSLPDLLWHFTTGADKQTQVRCELATSTEYEAFIQHVISGVDKQSDIAELMGKPKGTVSKWTSKAVNEGRIIKSGHSLKPTSTMPVNPSAKQDLLD